MSITIYHNPACGTSRNVLALIRNSGEEPRIIEYLKTPPSRAELVDLIARMGLPVRSVLREKGTPFHELGLDNPTLTDDTLIDAMIAHPILMNRPIVVTPLGVALCRPSEAALETLPTRSGALSSKKTARRSSMNPESGSPDAGSSAFRCHAGFCHLAASGAGHRLERNGRCRRGLGGWRDPLA